MDKEFEKKRPYEKETLILNEIEKIFNQNNFSKVIFTYENMEGNDLRRIFYEAIIKKEKRKLEYSEIEYLRYFNLKADSINL